MSFTDVEMNQMTEKKRVALTERRIRALLSCANAIHAGGYAEWSEASGIDETDEKALDAWVAVLDTAIQALEQRLQRPSGE